MTAEIELGDIGLERLQTSLRALAALEQFTEAIPEEPVRTDDAVARRLSPRETRHP